MMLSSFILLYTSFLTNSNHFSKCRFATSNGFSPDRITKYSCCYFQTFTQPCHWAIPEIRGTPLRQTYFKLKIWEFPGSNFDLKKMRKF